MSQEIETIDSSEMEILSEFADEEENGGAIAYRLGVLANNFVVASQASIAKKPQGKVVPENADERTKTVFERGIKYDWWRGTLVFELKNFDRVLERIEELYGVRPLRAIDLNAFEIESGKDRIGVRKNSVMPHNAGQPIVTLQISNTRRINVDGLELGGWDLYVSPETGEKLLDEMRKIQPTVKAKIQTRR